MPSSISHAQERGAASNEAGASAAHGGVPRRLFSRLSARHRRNLLLCIPFMAAAAIAEMLTIGAAFPFLLLASSSGNGTAALPPGPGVSGDLAWAAALLVVAVVCANVLRLAIYAFLQRTVAGISFDLSTSIQVKMINEPLSERRHHNSAEMIASLEKVQTVAHHLVIPALQGIVALGLAAGVVAMLLWLDPVVTAIATVIFLGSYLLAALLTHDRFRRSSVEAARAHTRRLKLFGDSIGALRNVHLDDSQAHFQGRFAAAERSYRSAHARSAVLAAIPRHIIETVGIGGFAIVVLFAAGRYGSFLAAVPALGALALGLQRLLPLLQAAWHGFAQWRSSRQSLDDVLAMSKAASPAPVHRSAPKLEMAHDIAFNCVSFAYPNGKPVLKDVSVRFRRGETIGITGRTGAGKSTLLDLLMGFLEPTSGSIAIDGRILSPADIRAWQSNIALVPQTIFLSDDTLRANIVFGLQADQAPDSLVEAAAAEAQAAGFINARAEGFDTRIGEDGDRLSGGERQRIGIARALLRGRPILVLDEATNGLDQATEEAVLNAAVRCASTRIIISHRPSVLRFCDRILAIEAGRVVEVHEPRSAAPGLAHSKM